MILLWSQYHRQFIQMEGDMQDLNESSIDLDEQEALSSSNSSNQPSEHQAADHQTFKGSFLLEMQKLTRTVIFEKRMYSIYSLQYQESQQHVLGFMEHEEEEKPYVLEASEGEIEEYVVDFQEKNRQECCCQCHQRQQQKEIKIVRRNSESKIYSDVKQHQKESIVDKLEFKPRSSVKKWTSISLKEYKQHIKKKLQEKR